MKIVLMILGLLLSASHIQGIFRKSYVHLSDFTNHAFPQPNKQFTRSFEVNKDKKNIYSKETTEECLKATMDVPDLRKCKKLKDTIKRLLKTPLYRCSKSLTSLSQALDRQFEINVNNILMYKIAREIFIKKNEQLNSHVPLTPPTGQQLNPQFKELTECYFGSIENERTRPKCQSILNTLSHYELNKGEVAPYITQFKKVLGLKIEGNKQKTAKEARKLTKEFYNTYVIPYE